MTVRAHAWNLVIVAVAGLGLAVAGCGTQKAPGSGASGGSSGGSGSGKAPAAAQVVLTFDITNGATKPATHWTLRCDPTGGTHPHAAATCAMLLKMKKPFALPAKHLMCPMIMVSDRSIHVKGTWFGTKINRVIVDGGCDLSLFNKVDTVMH